MCLQALGSLKACSRCKSGKTSFSVSLLKFFLSLYICSPIVFVRACQHNILLRMSTDITVFQARSHYQEEHYGYKKCRCLPIAVTHQKQEASDSPVIKTLFICWNTEYCRLLCWSCNDNFCGYYQYSKGSVRAYYSSVMLQWRAPILMYSASTSADNQSLNHFHLSLHALEFMSWTVILNGFWINIRKN